MQAVWEKNGIKITGDTEEEVDALRTFLKYIMDLGRLDVGLRTGNGKDLCTFFDFPYPTTDQEGSES